MAEMGIGPSLQAFEEVFPTLPYDSFTPSGIKPVTPSRTNIATPIMKYHFILYKVFR